VNRQQCSFANSICWILKGVALTATLLTVSAWGQNPVPQIVGPVKPMAVAPGSGAFTLTVYGANFVPGAVVNWNGQPRSTTFVSAHELQAQIFAADIAKNTAGLISVTNPGPGGGNSSASWAQVEVHKPISTIALKEPEVYPFGSYLVLAADFTHDEILDLVGQYGSDVLFERGRGDGSFRFGSIAGQYYNSDGGAYGDFNGDGNLDFAYGELPPNNANARAKVVLGDGQGRFKSGGIISNVHVPTLNAGVILAGDFNGDGKLDLIVTNLQGFSVFLGRGDGTFRHMTDIADSTLGPTWMVAGDFNGDGKLDIALFVGPDGQGSSTSLYLYLGNGDGTFQSQQTIFSATSIFGWDLRLSDLNGDGIPDLAFQTETQVCVLLGNGDGTFQPMSCTTVGTQRQFSYAIGDINSDGKPDLFVSDYSNLNNPKFVTYLGNGDGTFQPPQSANGFFESFGFVFGDFNADGLVDLIAPTGGGVEVFIQR